MGFLPGRSGQSAAGRFCIPAKRVRRGIAVSSSEWQNGELKFALTRRLLDIRQRYGQLFTEGDYEPLAMTGTHAAHVIGFARNFKRQRIVAIIGRHFAKLTDGGRHWPDQIDARFELEREWNCENLLTGEVD